MKFYVGQQFEHNGVSYRVLKGDRCDGDMVLEFRYNGWCRPAIAHSLILIEFKHQVEENNYPPPRYEGGAKLLRAIWAAVRDGWESVADSITKERAEKKRRDEGGTLL